MSEYGEIDAGQEHGSLEAVHQAQGHALDHQSQFGILEQDHHSVEHEEFEHLKHIEYTDAAGNHYEITEYTHYEHTEIEDDHTLMAYGQESVGEAGFGEADATDAGFGQAGFGASEAGFGSSSIFAGLEGITSRFENFLGSGVSSDNEINDASA
jgi:hypothetical protein